MKDSKNDERLRRLLWSTLYPLYLAKVERKGRNARELNQVIEWLTSFSEPDLERLKEEDVDLETFFERATINPKSEWITGVICGVRVEEIEDPFMQKIRYLDKIVDELAQGKALEKIFRSSPP